LDLGAASFLTGERLLRTLPERRGLPILQVKVAQSR
jgi:hypothetical protein